MPLPVPASVTLGDDVAGALASVPSGEGVGQILAGERNLVLGCAANLRRWAASHLGLGRRPAAGRRPRTNLAGIATAVAWVETDGRFHQRLVYERLMAPLAPPETRRDLAPPAFLHLDPAERFPRASVRGAESGLEHLFGPFADRRAAEKARDALLRAFPLRPCDLSFDPDPELAVGLACLFAQVRSCAAPCLARVSEPDYRALAVRAASWLADPGSRGPSPLPVTCARADAPRALVADVGRRRTTLFPLRAGRVLEDAAVACEPDEPLQAAIARLSWSSEAPPAADWPWLSSYLRSPRNRASYLVVNEGESADALAARVLAAFGGNLGGAREKP